MHSLSLGLDILPRRPRGPGEESKGAKQRPRKDGAFDALGGFASAKLALLKTPEDQVFRAGASTSSRLGASRGGNNTNVLSTARRLRIRYNAVTGTRAYRTVGYCAISCDT